ncbi:MAG: hypothetical protein KDA89_24485 [Planctomycetaceae bacterium]|nr:hypothetical protein [Planctomycetaceae bacterium]MCA9051928.1 hypothetical protein [Planctomycetaceae bacterium]
MKYLTKEFFLVLTVFSKEVFSVGAGESTADLYQIGVAAAGFLYYFRPRPIAGLVTALCAVFALSVILFTLYEFPVSSMFQRQAAAVGFIYLGIACYLLNCDRDRLVVAYFRLCYVAAVFGIIQFCLSAVGILILIKLPMRLDSFAAEPSHYAVAVAPVIYYCFRYCRSPKARRRAVVILSSLVLTVSTTAVAVFLVAFALAFYSRRGIFAILALSVAMPFLLMVPPDAFPEVIASRIISMREYFYQDANPWETTNLTVLSFATNFEVMLSTFKEGRILGNGFCGHLAAYERQYSGTAFELHPRYGINAPPAHCLVIRMLSEFGFLGLLVLGFGSWHFVSYRRTDLWSMFLLMAFVGRALKLGSWVDYGLPLFLLAPFYLPRMAPRTSVRRAPRGVRSLPSSAVLSNPPRGRLAAE